MWSQYPLVGSMLTHYQILVIGDKKQERNFHRPLHKLALRKQLPVKSNLLCRFESAVAAADRAYKRDQSNNEVSTVHTNILQASAARMKGNEYFLLKEYSKAIHAYNEGLDYARSNPSLLSNLEVCQWQLEKRHRCIQICNEVLQSRPDNTDALLQRANSYFKVCDLLQKNDIIQE